MDVTKTAEPKVIEFKGAYYKKGRSAPQSVLVQFDGVLLHVWHMSDPFHRLLTSDVFRLPLAIGQRKRCIKLPNGGRIFTDDINALQSLPSNPQSTSPIGRSTLWSSIPIVVAGALMLLAAALFCVKFMFAS